MDMTISTVWTAPWTVGGCATGTAILPSGTVPVDWPAAPSAPGRARRPRSVSVSELRPLKASHELLPRVPGRARLSARPPSALRTALP